MRKAYPISIRSLAIHEWFFDWPWEFYRFRDWFFMVGVGRDDNFLFLHVRFLGVRGTWEVPYRKQQKNNKK